MTNEIQASLLSRVSGRKDAEFIEEAIRSTDIEDHLAELCEGMTDEESYFILRAFAEKCFKKGAIPWYYSKLSHARLMAPLAVELIGNEKLNVWDCGRMATGATDWCSVDFTIDHKTAPQHVLSLDAKRRKMVTGGTIYFALTEVLQFDNPMITMLADNSAVIRSNWSLLSGAGCNPDYIEQVIAYANSGGPRSLAAGVL